MSYSEVFKLPIRYRRWFLDRLVRHFEDMYSKDKDKSVNKNMDNIDKYQDILDRKFS